MPKPVKRGKAQKTQKVTKPSRTRKSTYRPKKKRGVK